MLFAVKVLDIKNSKEKYILLQKESEDGLSLYLQKHKIISTNIIKLPRLFEYIYTNISISQISEVDIIFFFESLNNSLKIGIPIIVTLKDISLETKNVRFKYAIDDIIEKLENGYTIVDACKNHPKIFKHDILRVIDLGQKSNKFHEILDSITSSLKERYELQKNIKQALIYPTIALIIILGVFGFWAIYVVPKIVNNLVDTGLELPWYTLMLVDVFSYIKSYWYFMIGGFSLFVLLIRKLYKSFESFRKVVSNLLLKLPIVSNMIIEFNMVIISKYLSLILMSGKPLSYGIDILLNSISNLSYKDELKKISKDIKNGYKFSQTIENSKLFTRIMYRVVLAGEHGGNLAEELEKISSFYNQKLINQSKVLTRIIEPIVTIMLGVLIIVLILSFLSPIYSLIISIQ